MASRRPSSKPWMPLLSFFASLLFYSSHAALYPYGTSNGDTLVSTGTYNVSIKVTSPFIVGSVSHTNVAFDASGTVYMKSGIQISPLSDPLLRSSSISQKFYYRTSKNAALLSLAKADVSKAFPKIALLKSFAPKNIIVATWESFQRLYSDGSYDDYTFQIAIFWNETYTFACLNYVPYYPSSELSTLVLDLEIIHLPENPVTTNMGVDSKFIFQIQSNKVIQPTSLSTYPTYSLVSGFYPFGRDQNQTLLVGGKSPYLSLSGSPLIQKAKRSVAQVGIQGTISFGSSFSISPFKFADPNQLSNVRLGKVYYSLVQTPSFLSRLESDVKIAFPNIAALKTFKASRALVVTWYNVRLYSSLASGLTYYSRYLFQSSIFWSTNVTFICNVYKNLDFDSYLLDVSAYIGSTYFSLSNLVSDTNVGQTGKYCYRIDSSYVQEPTKLTIHPIPQWVKKFYIFGPYLNDKTLVPASGTKSPYVALSGSPKILGTSRTSVIVYALGIIEFTPKIQIAPLKFDSIDPTEYSIPITGKIYYATSKRSEILTAGNSDIKKAFPSLAFNATNAFLTTWYLAPAYMFKTLDEFGGMALFRLVNTFQSVLLWDSKYTFVCFLYDVLEFENDVSLFRSSFIGSKQLTLTVDLGVKSNMGVPGKFCYRIDSTTVISPKV